ncbi:3'-5' exonuclease [Natronosalvus caseinilyticus]|uniref:3'-5' exonuclease n=1 Tax=Natronosalvus caseinilyticus TaxID=2953747 RepID=UPI0028AF5448|nr:AAA family ATPase [Natronosalvus caseinilyticus]
MTMNDGVEVPRYPIVGCEDVPITESAKINGPPGTGKTTQGLCRVQCLVAEEGYDVDDVTWITYRRSLADDLIEQMVDWGLIEEKQLIDPQHGATKQISTAHAVCYRLQRDEFQNRRTPSWDDYRRFCDEYYSVPYSTPVSSGSKPRGETLFGVYYWLKNNRKSMLEATDCDRYMDLMEIWPTSPSLQRFETDWEGFKEQESLVDYHEYLERALERSITPETDIVVIDEYHDAFPLLHALAKEWINDAKTAIVLGDPQQVVNHHEGASPAFFEELDLPEIHLMKTHRVPKLLWNAASNVLKGYHTPHTPDFASSYEGNALDEVHAPTFWYDQQTNTWEAPTGQRGSPDSLIERYVEAGEQSLFLVRARFQQHGIAAGFKDTGIIFCAQERSAGCWHQDNRKRHLYNALKRLEGYDENTAVYLRGPEVQELLHYTRAEDLEYNHSTIETVANSRWMRNSVVHVNAIDDLVTDSWWNRYTRGETSVAFLVEREGEHALPRAELMAALARNAEPTVDVEREGDGLANAPTIMTIHASKGTEADRVFVYDGVTKRIRRETRKNIRADANEDRTWYVALTRASKQTIVVRGAFEFMSSHLPSKGVLT